MLFQRTGRVYLDNDASHDGSSLIGDDLGYHRSKQPAEACRFCDFRESMAPHEVVHN